MPVQSNLEDNRKQKDMQQDGKLIGVISHVPALKERIGTQLAVTPESGGRSLLSGPGCLRG